MDSKKFWLASAVATGIFWTGSALWYSGLLKGFYRGQARGGVQRRRPKYSVDVLSRMIYGMWFAWEYPRSTRLHSNTPLRDGARYGAWAGSLQAVPASLAQFANTRVKLPAVLASGAFETALGAVAGMAVSAVYRSDRNGASEPLPVEDEETAHHSVRSFARHHQQQSQLEQPVPRRTRRIRVADEPITADVQDPMQPPTGAPPEAEVAG